MGAEVCIRASVLAHARTLFTAPEVDQHFATGHVVVVFLESEVELVAGQVARREVLMVRDSVTPYGAAPFCVLIDASGRRTIDKADYDAFVARAEDDLDLFLDLASPVGAGRHTPGRRETGRYTQGSVPGAGWLDIQVSLPLRTLAALLALVLAVAVTLRLPRPGLRAPAVLISGGVLLLVPLLEAVLLPVLQLIVVKPRELEREAPYLARSIRATREAFQLNRMVSRNVNPKTRLTRADVEASLATLRNIRLWDSQPLLPTNKQLQKLRDYYRFSELAVDRYDLCQPRVEGCQPV